jgi:cation diffusion facilitator CzcD-associated flavoprotein CzcO
MAKLAPLVPWMLLLMAAGKMRARAEKDPENHDYCIIGAGPAGLQMAYFLQQAGREYVVFERSDHPGKSVAWHSRLKDRLPSTACRRVLDLRFLMPV